MRFSCANTIDGRTRAGITCRRTLSAVWKTATCITRARGERVQTIDPAFTGGSRDPQTAIEEKKLERHLARQADLEAERRKFGEIVRDDETGQYLGGRVAIAILMADHPCK
jgi:hypothetical protein